MPESTATEAGLDPSHGYFAALGSYLELGTSAVEGWLSPTTAAMLAHMLVRQVQTGIKGDVCEIGVHHGKLFLVLANATIPGEAAIAVDVFDQQEKNLDQSGRGDRAVFEHNVAAYAPGAALQVIQESSLDLQKAGFLERRFRFVSIDGGHTAQAAENDLWLAEKTLVDGGIAALDDILSAHWTGVLTGLVNFFSAGGNLVPCALLPNKLVLAKTSASAARWRADLRKHFPLAVAKADLEFLGAPIDSYDEHSYYSQEARTGLLAEMRDLRTQLQAASAEAAAYAQEIATLKQTVVARQQELAQAPNLPRECDALPLEIEDVSIKASAREREAEGLHAALHTLTEGSDLLRQEIDALHRSTSWRSTAPLRAVSSLVRRKR